MSIGSGWFFAAALLLAGAGIAKLSHPEPIERALATAKLPADALLQRLPSGRIAGTVEIVVAAAALGFGNRLTAALVTAAYLVFAAVAWRLLTVQATRQPCGCFGESSTPVSPVHVVVNLSAAAAGVVAVVSPPGTLLHLTRLPWSGVPFLIGTLTLTWLTYLAFTAVPELLTARASVDALRETTS